MQNYCAMLTKTELIGKYQNRHRAVKEDGGDDEVTEALRANRNWRHDG